MDYCLNLNSSTKLKQSPRTTKQNHHFYFTKLHTLFIKPQFIPHNLSQTFFARVGANGCVWAILGRIFRYYR